jgi:hypothetical protein
MPWPGQLTPVVLWYQGLTQQTSSKLIKDLHLLETVDMTTYSPHGLAIHVRSDLKPKALLGLSC